MSVRNSIPENYDLRKIVEALIKELEDSETLNMATTRVRIIEKGNPERKQ
jgi:predicted DNA-binding protein